MKTIIITTIVLSLLALMLLACAPEASVESSTPSTATMPATAVTELTDEQLLQQHPDYLDEALQELEEVG